jgi:hypothetical protein
MRDELYLTETTNDINSLQKFTDRTEQDIRVYIRQMNKRR